MECLVVCIPGLERVVGDELKQLGLRVGRRERGMVNATGNERQIYAANMWLRTATRVLIPLGGFRATTFAELTDRAESLDWSQVVSKGTIPAFRVTSHASKLFHTDAVAERLAALFGGDGTEVPGEEHPLIVVRINADNVSFRADASGAALHKRGWRRQVGKAPVRESIAAAMVAASGWDHQSPLIDPFCGSGTIVIEAALAAADVAPGLDRPFALQSWPSFAPGTWASVTGDAKARAAKGLERMRTEGSPLLVATDRDAGAVQATHTNAARAGVEDLIEIRRASVSDLPVLSGVTPGWVLTNPPWGGRLDGGGDLRDLYARLGQVVASGQAEGWQAGILCGDDRLAGHTGLALRAELRLVDSGIDVEFLVTT